MKKVWLPLVAAVALPMLSTSAFADVKIGVVNLQQVLQNAPQTKKITAQLKEQFQPREKKLEADQDKFRQEVMDFEKNKSVMKASDVTASQNKLMKEQQDLQQSQISFNQDFMNAQNKLGGAFLSQVKDTINKVAADGKYNIILTSTDNITNSSVAYADASTDITDKVLSALK